MNEIPNGTRERLFKRGIVEERDDKDQRWNERVEKDTRPRKRRNGSQVMTRKPRSRRNKRNIEETKKRGGGVK
jgi:hypothetical protein